MNTNLVETERLTLKPITVENSKRLFDIYSNPEVCKYFDIEPYKDLFEAEKQINSWINQAKEGKQYRFSISYNNIVVGTCGIYSIYNHQNRASIGYDLDPEYWGKGIMTEALSIFLQVLKKDFKIHRIQGTVLPNHIASKKLLQRLGFIYEGTLLGYEKWKGEYVDLEMYSKILESI